MLDVKTALLAATAALNAGLFLFVCIGGRGNPTQYSFAAFVLSLSLWSALHVGFRLVSSDAVAAELLKLSYVCAIFIGASFYYFSTTFPEGKEPGVTHRFLLAVVTVLFSFALLTPGFLTGPVVHEPYGRSVLLHQGDYLGFAVVFSALFVGGQIRVWRKFRGARGVAREQLLAIGASVTTIGLVAMYCDLVLPSPFLENFRYVWAGPVLTSIFAITTTYAIFRYRLFNLKTAATELLVFGWWLFILVRALAANSILDFLADQVLLILSVPIGTLLLRSLQAEEPGNARHAADGTRPPTV